MTTDTNFVATGPGNVGVEVQSNVNVGVEATGTSAGGSFHLPASTVQGRSAVTADNPLCNARLCTIGRRILPRELFGIAVFGNSGQGTGVMGESDSGIAVMAQSNSGPAIFATSFSERGVHGQSGTGPGVQGQTDTGVGVLGRATSGGLAGSFEGNVEVTGNMNCHASDMTAILAREDPKFNTATGVYGESAHFGVVGNSNGAPELAGCGALGVANQSGSNFDPTTGGTGVLGSAYIGVRGETQTGVAVMGRRFGSGLAGKFEGDVEVTGNISCSGKVQGGSLEVTGNINCHGKVQGGSLEVTNVKATHVNAGSIDANTIVAHNKSFRIDHPTDPMRKYLIHATIESSEMMNLYSGVVVLDGKGEAEVALPEWFEALNRNFRYQLTCVGSFAPVYIARKIANNAFKIAGGHPGLEVCWQVAGTRHDRWAREHPFAVEVEKQPSEYNATFHENRLGLEKADGEVVVP